MRRWVLVLTLGAGTMAFCQSSAQAPVNPHKSGELPHTFNWPGTDFSKTPPVWSPGGVLAQPIIVELRDASSARLLNGAKIDPGIIVHPPKTNLGAQPQGTLMARNQYPGLQFLPIEVSRANLEPIPITWPNLKLQPIPIEWPKARPLPVVGPMPATNSYSPQ